MEGGEGVNFLKKLNTVVGKIVDSGGVQDAEPWEPPKPKKKKKLTSDAPYLQPRSKDYNGQGLARPSIFIDLEEPGFEPLFAKEFFTHVDGFYGKVKTKAMKKQRAAEAMGAGGGEMGGAVDASALMKGKGMEGLTPDQKVEMLMRKGML